MRFFLFFFFFTVLLFANANNIFEKQLSSKNRAETYLENLIFDGEFDKAEKFSIIANKKYPSNANLLCWSGKLYIEKKDLELAKKYFLQVLALDPVNEIAKLQLELIEEQESIKENKNIEQLLSFIEDKGLDFLMVFLAFLGGELIAKRYNVCKNSSVYIMANYFIKEKLLQKHNKFTIILDNYKQQKIFSFCFFINLLVIITIALVLMIIWLFIAFHYELNIFIYGNFLTMNAKEIEYNFIIVFVFTFFITLIARAIMQYIELPTKNTLYEISFVEELDRLVSEGEYVALYKVMQYLKKNNLKDADVYDLINKYSNESDYILLIYNGK